MVYGTYGKIHLWPYIHQALLSVNMAESLKYPTAFSASLYKISTVCGRRGKIHLSPYENQALLQISIAKKLSCLATISEDLLYQISAIYIEQFIGYMEKSIYSLR
jgi:hypothetical protein